MNTAAEVPDSVADTSPTLPLLREPASGIPPIVDTPTQLKKVAARFAAADGPVAVDAERASGFRYGQKTYLAQFKRAGAGIALIDTAALDDLSPLAEALAEAEWVLHAASQDLPGLRDLGMHPSKVFDTELAARLLGWPKVGLAAVVERELEVRLAKEHSAQDWSRRPLPESWLAYAALDVEVLLDLRASLVAHLTQAGKLEWAEQESEHVRTMPAPAPKPDPWRRVSGTHSVKNPRQLGIVKELWKARDARAQAEDISPGRLLRDAAIIAAATAQPTSVKELLGLKEFRSRGAKKYAREWNTAIAKAQKLPDSALPDRRGPRTDGPPAPRMWKERNPEAATRLHAARSCITALSEAHEVPPENLLQPDALRRLCWENPGTDTPSVEAFLASRGARLWQRELVSAPLAEALTKAAQSAPED